MTPLQESIAHWERMRDNKALPNEQPYVSWCALCETNRGVDGKINCSNCPVMKHTGFTSCYKTPYYYARLAFSVHGINSPKFRKAAQAEIDFLKSLEPND